MLESRWPDAIGALDRLQRLSDDSAERATLMYRMGRLYEDRLHDDERAMTEYLRAGGSRPQLAAAVVAAGRPLLEGERRRQPHRHRPPALRSSAPFNRRRWSD